MGLQRRYLHSRKKTLFFFFAKMTRAGVWDSYSSNFAVIIFLVWLELDCFVTELMASALQSKDLQKKIQFQISPCHHSSMTCFLLFSPACKGKRSRLKVLYKRCWGFSQLLTPFFTNSPPTSWKAKEAFYYTHSHEQNSASN